MFVVVLLVGSPLADWPFGPDSAAPRLIILAIVLPIVMARLAASVLAPAVEIERAWEDLHDLYERARLDSLVDPLTGLGNHRAFQEEVLRQVEEARRYDGNVSLLLIDIDDLKRVNDERGHAAGDELLSSIGRLILASIRRADRAFRVGGDEFVVLMPQTDAESAAVLSRRLLAAALGGEPTGESGEPISFSGGISAFPELASDGARLYRQADAALYWCKRHGRTDIQVFDPARHGASGDDRSERELAVAVASAAADRALAAVFQPIRTLDDGVPIGHEALVRPGPDAGFRNAEAMFSAAEATGRTVELDMACLQIVAASAGPVPAGRYLSVNISPRTLETAQFSPGELVSIFARYGISPTSLVLELTEREAVSDVERLRTNVEACRRLGMRIAADDVGAGNAGLRLLSEIRFDIVKVDLSLVQGGALRESSYAVLRALGELAARSSAVIVAEGVETAQQLEVIRELGFTAAQGYLLGRPTRSMAIEATDIEALIAADRLRHQGMLAEAAPAATR
jgi:diguanylate cyclase (GGDEF)-like protein